MELKYLNTVKTIVESGSFQKAAEKLNYTQSTITYQIQQMEQELSVKLFDKIGRHMVITQAGKDIFPYIDTILQSVRQIENYGKTNLQMSGTLKVSMPESLLTYKVQSVLKIFKEQAPKVNLSLKTLNCHEVHEQVVNGSSDIGIYYDIVSPDDRIVSNELSSFTISLIASLDLKEKDCDFTTPNQRKDISLLSNYSEGIFQQVFIGYLKDKGIAMNNVIELGSVEAVKRSVASNLGIALLPTFTVEEELDKGRLKKLEIDLSAQHIKAIYTYHKNKWISPAMELFIRILRILNLSNERTR